MSETRIVNRGVDTLLLNVYYTDQEKPIWREIDAGLASLLDEWEKTAQEIGGPYISAGNETVPDGWLRCAERG
ncbi:MAG: hypothetical protein WCD86_04760 [Ktedonobacteraceae bacterium]